MENGYDFDRLTFYESVTDQLLDSFEQFKISKLDFEVNEQWFIDLIDTLYDLCPTADTFITSKFVLECWNYKCEFDKNDTENPSIDLDEYDYYHDPY